MNEKSLPTSATPEITLDAYGSLAVKGWEQPLVQVKALEEDCLTLEGAGNAVRVRCTCGCTVMVPQNATLVFENVFGEAIINHVRGPVVVQRAASKLILSDVGPTTIGLASGAVLIKNVHGGLTVERASSSLTASQIEGDVTLEGVGGHVHLSELHGNLTAQTSGSTHVMLDPQPGFTYAIESHGVLNCHLPDDLNAELHLRAYGPGSVNVGNVRKLIIGGELNLTFGEGAAQINLSSNGPANIIGSQQAKSPATKMKFEFDLALGETLEGDPGGPFEGFAEELAQQVNEQVQAQMEMLDAQLSQIGTLAGMPGLSPEKAEQIAQRTQERVAQAREKIQRAAQRAQERTARRIEAAQRRAERHAQKTAAREARTVSRRRGYGSAPPGELVSEEERLIILQMLASQKITAEEADRLLSALEGN